MLRMNDTQYINSHSSITCHHQAQSNLLFQILSAILTVWMWLMWFYLKCNIYIIATFITHKNSVFEHIHALQHITVNKNDLRKTSYFCTCTTFSASYTYKSTWAYTSTTSSSSVGFFVRRTRVRRTNVRACCIQMSLLSSLAFQIKWCF